MSFPSAAAAIGGGNHSTDGAAGAAFSAPPPPHRGFSSKAREVLLDSPAYFQLGIPLQRSGSDEQFLRRVQASRQQNRGSLASSVSMECALGGSRQQKGQEKSSNGSDSHQAYRHSRSIEGAGSNGRGSQDEPLENKFDAIAISDSGDATLSTPKQRSRLKEGRNRASLDYLTLSDYSYLAPSPPKPPQERGEFGEEEEEGEKWDSTTQKLLSRRRNSGGQKQRNSSKDE